jgi:predicted DCC family thiol-disulfide oxidoreductase YuxK
MFLQTHDPSVQPTELGGQHLLLYDGVCGLCDRTIRFVLPRDPRGHFRFAALQSALGREQLVRHGRDPDVLTTFFVIENFRSATPRLVAGSRAAFFVLERLKGPWKYAGIARVLPNFVLEAAYSLIARNRYWLFGRLDRCLLPESNHIDRFVEVQAQVDVGPQVSHSSPAQSLRSRGTRDSKTSG